MFGKKLLAVAITSAVASQAFAFQNEVDLVYGTNDAFDTLGIAYTYHFSDVNLDGTAWAEAPFMQRSSYVGLGHVQLDIDGGGSADGQTLFARGVFAQDWYVEGQFTSSDADDTIGLGLGYYYGENKSVYLNYSDSDFLSTISVGIKNVYTLDGGRFFALDASLTDWDGDAISLDFGGDYYFSGKTSVGLGVALFDDSDIDPAFELRANHYFSEGVGVGFSYTTQDSEDEIGLSANFRF